MVKDLIVSFSDNFKEKTKNPFLGTYLIIWIIRNWELVYSLFNFDDSFKRDDKINFVKEYYKTNSFIENILQNLGWTFLVLTITYVVLNLSRFIVNISEKQIKPLVYKMTDSKSIVLKPIHEQVKNERDSLLIRLDSERDSKSKLEIKIKQLEEEISKVRLDKIDNQNKSKNEIEKPSSTQIIYEKLSNENLLNEFSEFAVNSNKDGYTDENYKHTDRFIELGLIKYKRQHWNNDSKQYTITSDGEEVLRYMRLQ